MRERGPPPQFLPPDDFVRDEHVRDPALNHRIRDTAVLGGRLRQKLSLDCSQLTRSQYQKYG
jgi:hypothetical protein